MFFFHYRYQSDKKLVVVKKGILEELNFELNPIHLAQPATKANLPTTVIQDTTHLPPVSSPSPTTVRPTTKASVSTSKLLTSSSASTDSLPIEFKHHHYEEMVAVLKMVSKKCPNISHLYSIGETVEKRQLYVLEMSDNPGVHEPGMYGWCLRL